METGYLAALWREHVDLLVAVGGTKSGSQDQPPRSPLCPASYNSGNFEPWLCLQPFAFVLDVCVETDTKTNLNDVLCCTYLRGAHR